MYKISALEKFYDFSFSLVASKINGKGLVWARHSFDSQIRH